MSSRTLRFLHASDLHLEQPLQGVAAVPEHLRELFVDAPLTAADAMFEAAISERVDFVLLVGDILHPQRAGPRGVSFLHRQFQRLGEAKIAVFWSQGADPSQERWPGALALPENVHIFDEEHVEAVSYRRGGGPPATIFGRRGTARIDADEFESTPRAYTVAVVHGLADPDELPHYSVNYWALGGRHNRTTLTSSATTAHYSGTPQGRQPREDGPHGCTLVEVNERGETETTSINTDVVRWHTRRVDLPADVDRHGLLRLLRQRTVELAETAAGRLVLVGWVLTDGDQLTDTRSDLLAARLRQGDLAGELLQDLRREFGHEVPGVWPLTIEAQPPTVFPSGWYEEDTVLGDLLRAVQQHQSQRPGSLRLDPPGLSEEMDKALAPLLAMGSADRYQELLRRVAALAVDVLRGDRVLSEDFAAVSDDHDRVAMGP